MQSLGLVMLIGVLSTVWNDGPVEVDRSEVLRMGDLVQKLDGTIGFEDDANSFVAAMGPPASDADKWFVSVLSMQGCGACQRLKADWRASPHLMALANPTDPKQSWAHYNEYWREDQSQAFRFEKLRVTAFPTILVQPPRTGRYGPPGTVVFQGAYGGDPQLLAQQITSAIRLYVSKFEAHQPAPQTTGVLDQRPYGADPPWQPAPKVEPHAPSIFPVFPDARPLIPPVLDQRPSLFALLGKLLFELVVLVVGVIVTVALVLWLIAAVRKRQSSAGPLTLDDLTLERLVPLLRDLVKEEVQKLKPTRSRSR